MSTIGKHNAGIKDMLMRYERDCDITVLSEDEWRRVYNGLIANYFRGVYTVVSDVNAEARWAIINEGEIDVIYSRGLPMLPIHCMNLYTYCLMCGVYIPYTEWLGWSERLVYGGRVYYRSGDLFINEDYVTSDTSGEGNEIAIPL